MNIDESFKELETIVSRMENNPQSIEEALADYDKGMALVKSLKSELSGIEKKIKVINAETGEEDEM
ncbi:MAG: exodeoxyribonuclease VII small subunit [Lachnospiraceae bacterium]|nr:exodeoxyribonuclease VII small subunit [Lachnospiraceae bacterium]MCR4927713.1 exodeoxyribonuclease VII small subunit [Lachnospiraceae bacterium]